MADFNSWKYAVLGSGLDIDHAYGNQCVDVALSWGQALFPGVPWSKVFPPVASAKDMFAAANTEFFEKIVNNHSDPNQLPQQGDIAIFDATPAAGYSNQLRNPDGHTGVVDSASAAGIYLVQQDGSNPAGRCFESLRPWRYSPCIGWLRPKASPVPPPPAPPATAGKTLHLPANVATWRVYPLNKAPRVGNECGFLLPSKFGGLSYAIEANPYPNVYTITTQAFGRVNIYAGPDTVATIS